MKILFLINNAFGVGGTIQTTFNLGGALAERGHEVQILSTVRGRDVPQLQVDPRVRLSALVETRKAHPDYETHAPGRGKPPRIYPRADYRAEFYDRFVEERYRAYLQGSDADVVIATRPGLIAYAARLAPQRMVKIGQEHLTRDRHRQALRRVMPGHLRRLDAFVTVSARDAEDYHRHLSLRRTRLLHIPNSVPAPRVAASHGRAKLVLAAGRLVRSKRYDVLIRAFATVVAERPDWTLRLYGEGPDRNSLRALVLELGLHNHVRLMGAYAPIETEWAKGTIAAVSADKEPFGMTLVEAMRAGLPVVSTDAPHGPGEILTDGVDGLLTPVGDVDALGAALLRLINDDAGRRAMAARALENSQRYDPGPIAARYEQLFEELASAKRRWWHRRPGTPVTALGPARPTSMVAADCEVTAEGRLVLLGTEGTAMCWRRIGAGRPAEVPVNARVPSGSWRLHLTDGTPVPAGRRDTRALLELPDATRIELPYRLADGSLALRVTESPVRAEVDELQADRDGIHLTGRLIGAQPTAPALLACCEGEEREFPATAAGNGFRASVPASLPAGDWRLWLRPAADRRPVRVAKVADDIIDKRTAYVLPSTPAMRPFFSGGNELWVRVRG